MKIVRVNATTDIELHDRFINVVRDGGVFERKYYEPIDKRNIGNICKIDHKETTLLGNPIDNKERSVAEFKLIIKGRDQRPIKELEFISEEDRDLVYEELEKDILSKTK